MGISGSIVSAAAIEQPQRELVKLIEQAGLSPSRDDLGQVAEAVTILSKRQVEGLEKLVPAEASEINQLADKQFVHSSMATIGATAWRIADNSDFNNIVDEGRWLTQSTAGEAPNAPTKDKVDWVLTVTNIRDNNGNIVVFQKAECMIYTPAVYKSGTFTRTQVNGAWAEWLIAGTDLPARKPDIIWDMNMGYAELGSLSMDSSEFVTLLFDGTTKTTAMSLSAGYKFSKIDTNLTQAGMNDQCNKITFPISNWESSKMAYYLHAWAEVI